MEFILAKIYLIIIFTILVISALFLILQIQLRQNLEKTLLNLQSQPENKRKSPENQFKLGQIYLRKKNYNKAIQEFRSSFKNWNINDKLGLASLLNTVGFTYYQLKEYEIAMYYYKIAIQLTPDYSTCLINLAYIYQRQNEIDELRKLLNQIDKYDPENKNLKSLFNYLSRYSNN